jgi:hypothetical protein
MNGEKKQWGWLSVVLVISLLCGCSEGHENKPSSDAGSPARFNLNELKADIDQLLAGLDDNPKLFTDLAAYESVIEEQKGLLGQSMSRREFYNIVTPIVAAIRCGHTSVSMPSDSNAVYKLIPLEIRFVNNKAYIIVDNSGSGIKAGTELVSINSKSIDDIAARMLQRITADGDNQSTKPYKLNNWFGYLYTDLIEEPDTYAVEVTPEGTDEVVRYDLVPTTTSVDQLQAADAVPSGDFKANYATLIVGSFNFYDAVGQTAFKERVDAFFGSLSENKTGNLILDLRNNWGGDPTVAAYLLSHLISEPIVYFSSEYGGGAFYDALTKPLEVADNAFHGNLYVLVNGASFSSTGHVASLLAYHHIGTFVGQETGGGYLCTDNTKSLVLDHTGLVLRSSRTIFKAAVEGMVPGRGIIPDYETTRTVADYVNGVDLEMAKAIELIGEQ